MSEYIKREDVEQIFTEWCHKEQISVMFCDVIMRRLQRLPSADVVEVRHGYWDNDMECSICGCLAPVSHVTGEEYAYEYCPNCGAKMDRKEKEQPNK